MLEYKTQIIKLQNGTDLIANVCMLGQEHYVLDEPMEFGVDFHGQSAGLVMKHYLPVQLLKKNQMEIHAKDVLSVMDPDDEFCEYYINTVSKIKALLQARNIVNEMTDEEISEAINNFEEINYHGNTIH